MFEFSLDGVEETIADLEARFSGANMRRIQDTALQEGADFMRKKLYNALDNVKVSGAIRDELTFSEPRYVGTERVITIHWVGNRDRFRVIHLVEKGFFHENSGRFVKPEGYGLIENTLNSNLPEYLRIVRNSIQRQIGAA